MKSNDPSNDSCGSDTYRVWRHHPQYSLLIGAASGLVIAAIAVILFDGLLMWAVLVIAVFEVVFLPRKLRTCT